MKPKHTLTELLTQLQKDLDIKLRYEDANDSCIATSPQGREWYARIADLESRLFSIEWWLKAVEEVEMMDRADSLFAEALLRKMDLGRTEPHSLFDHVCGMVEAHDRAVLTNPQK